MKCIQVFGKNSFESNLCINLFHISVLPKVGVCNKLVVPMCNDLGYNHTVLSSSTQIKIFKAALNTSVVPAVTTNKTYLPPYMQWTFRYYPKCAVTLKKMFCARFFPPCYPGESKQYYAVCKSECIQMYELCPRFFRRHLSELEYCTRASGGKVTHGFCAHDKWPQHWLVWPSKFRWEGGGGARGVTCI